VLLLAAVVLTTCAWLRGGEYDEQYTLFLTAGTTRPAWPDTAFPADTIARVQSGHASLGQIAHDLRTTDVHPPLYFWMISLWRSVFGPSLFAARLFSVLCAIVALSAVGVIARRSGIRPVLAMLLTLGSYGFVYTGVVARGFAPAQALTLCGVALLTGPGGRFATLSAGALFGAACCCNYLAVFVCATVAALVGGWLILPGAIPFLALDGWFFAAQHGARVGQFPPFSLLAALPRLGSYQVAAMFGGLPLCFEGIARIVVGAAVGVLAVTVLAAVALARPFADRRIRLLLAAGLAPAAGLLTLGAAFDNTPIELRYLSFGVPFLALLIAWACQSLDRRQRTLLAVIAAVQCASIMGLAVASGTMQPARYTARDAAGLAGNAIVLVPRGNDGVGIVGAFGLEAPAALPILLVGPAESSAGLLVRTERYQRVALALLAQDRDSTVAVQVMRQAFAGPDADTIWRRVASGFNIEVYERTVE
jgi:hypothetical protein